MGLTEFYSTPLGDLLLSVFTFTATEHSPVHDEQHGAGSARCQSNAWLRPHGALPTG